MQNHNLPGTWYENEKGNGDGVQAFCGFVTKNMGLNLLYK